MPKKRKTVAIKDEEVKVEEVAYDDLDPTSKELVPYEMERLKIIQRNRERLMALGIPSLAAKFTSIVKPAPQKPKKQPKKSKAAKKIKIEEPEDDGELTADQPRRSIRIRGQASKPKKETTEEKFERELGEFIVSGECPKCGNIYEKQHKQHLQSCSGPRSKASTTGYSKLDKELLSSLTEEEKKDEKKRTLARMKALDLSGLVEYSTAKAEFVVIGSKGDPYTVTLADDKHKCTCLDYRFRRHHCKHICLALSEIGALDNPENWYEAVGNRLDYLVERGEHHLQEEEAAGIKVDKELVRDKEAEMAWHFVE